MRYFRLVNSQSITYKEPHDPSKRRTVVLGEIVKARTPIEVDYFASQPGRFTECTQDGILMERPASLFGHKVRPIAVFKFRRGKEPELVPQIHDLVNRRPVNRPRISASADE